MHSTKEAQPVSALARVDGHHEVEPYVGVSAFAALGSLASTILFAGLAGVLAYEIMQVPLLPRWGAERLEASKELLAIWTWHQASPLLVAQTAVLATAAVLSVRWMGEMAEAFNGRYGDAFCWRRTDVGLALLPPLILWRPLAIVRALCRRRGWAEDRRPGWAVAAWMWWLTSFLAVLAVGVSFQGAVEAGQFSRDGQMDDFVIATEAMAVFAVLTQIFLVLASLAWVVVSVRLLQPELAAIRSLSSPLSALKKPAFFFPAIAAVGVAYVMSMPDSGVGGTPDASGGWAHRVMEDPMSDERIERLIASAVEVDGASIAPVMSIGCRSNGLGMTIYFPVALEDAFPDGNADIVRVTVRLDTAAPEVLAWIPSDDWRSVHAIDQESMSAGLQNLAVVIFGSLLPGARNLNAGWKAEQLARAMAVSQQMLVRVPARNGAAITARFDLSSFGTQFAKLPGHCR